jgi:hypothetical protein
MVFQLAIDVNNLNFSKKDDTNNNMHNVNSIEI